MGSYRCYDRGNYAVACDHGNLTREKVAEIMFEKLYCRYGRGDIQYLPFFNLLPEERERRFIADELDFDSLDMVELQMNVEKTFNITFNREEEQKLFNYPIGRQIDLIYAKTQEKLK